jgi:hypothetical protein
LEYFLVILFAQWQMAKQRWSLWKFSLVQKIDFSVFLGKESPPCGTIWHLAQVLVKIFMHGKIS